MPERPNPKIRNPFGAGSIHARAHGSSVEYVELSVASNYTFLTGASHPDELVRAAASLGHFAAALTDTNSLAGVVRAHVAAKEIGIDFVVGARVEAAVELAAAHRAEECLSILLYATDRGSYGRLSRLLTVGKRRAAKGRCQITVDDVVEHQAGLLAIVRGLDFDIMTRQAREALRRVVEAFDDDRISLAIVRGFDQRDRARTESTCRLCDALGVAPVIINDVLYHDPNRRALQDVLMCIREGCTIDQAGTRLAAHAERHLKAPEEMSRLFEWLGEAGRSATRRTVVIARRALGFSLDDLRYEYPTEVVPAGTTAMEHLTSLVMNRLNDVESHQPVHVRTTPKSVAGDHQGAAKNSPVELVKHELRLIEELEYAHYFLTVHDLVEFARSRGILCQGRGAAANSAVCYYLGITSVDPTRIDLLFERFVSKERNEPPDIDIDFEHERREEVIQYLYAKYGRDRCALTAVVITYRGRSAIRDVGKAMGLSLDCVERLAGTLDWWERGVVDDARLRALGLNPADPRLRVTLRLAGEILGFPRHLSQHVGGFVITRGLLCEMAPIENAAMPDRTIIEWDKDDIDALGMLKVDVLGLGMLTAVRRALALVSRAGRSMTFGSIPDEDPAVYDMICRADTVGVFQVESRAQMSMLPRLRPRCFYDLVIEVAIVRPGPIQGDMVHPYLRRRNGEESIEYPSPEVRTVLGKTLGVPLFQEQAMRLAIVAAGFTAGEADQLRRAMAAWKRRGDRLLGFEGRFIGGMLSNGYSPDFARRCFDQLKGFSEYGFPESHAASFALIVYVSAWLKHYYPAEFTAALINSQPLGFYAPAQLVRDAKEHGVFVKPVDVNHSRWDCTVDDDPTGPALRLGLRLVKGLGECEGCAIERAVRMHGEAASIEDLRRSSGVTVAALRSLARADAFNSMNLDRQAALWSIRSLRDEMMPLFEVKRDHSAADRIDLSGVQDAPEPRIVDLPQVNGERRVLQDYASIGLSLKGHPVAGVRERLRALGAVENQILKNPMRAPHLTPIAVAGLILVRQRPSTASGVVFITLEDETGIANLILRPGVYERFRKAARHGVLVMAKGRIERQGEVVHIMVRSIHDLTESMEGLEPHSRDFH